MVWQCWYSVFLLDFWLDILPCVYTYIYICIHMYIEWVIHTCSDFEVADATFMHWCMKKPSNSVCLRILEDSVWLQVVLKAVKCDGWALQWADQVGEVGIRRWGCWWFFGLEVFFFLKACCVLYKSCLFFFFQSRFLLFFLAVFRLCFENVERIFYRNWLYNESGQFFVTANQKWSPRSRSRNRSWWYFQ